MEMNKKIKENDKMTRIDELKAEKKKLEVEKTNLRKKIKAEQKKKAAAKKENNKIPAWMPAKSKY